MKIAVSNPAFFFAFFYVLSFGITFLLFIIFSTRLKIPLRTVLLLLTTVSLCTIIGSRLSTIPFSEWGDIVLTGHYESYKDRYAVGGLIFGLAGLILCKKTLVLDKAVINLYAWITPVGLGIQKIGCLLNGCCYGKPSDLPWSVQYARCTNAHYHQWISGMIDENAAFSLKVHPVQLYEVILLFIIAFIVWKSLKFWKKTWSALIFSICFFSVFRFLIEFLRDQAVSANNLYTVLGISMVQWFMLGIGIISAITLLLYEKSSEVYDRKLQLAEPSLKSLIVQIISVSAIMYVFRGLFTNFELISVNIKFIPAVILIGLFCLKSVRTFRFRLATSSFFVLPLFLVVQTFSSDSTKSASVRDFYRDVKSYKRIDLNTSLGEHYNTVRYNPHEGQCGTAYTEENYKYEYRIAGAGFSVVSNKGESISAWGINLYGGIIKENNLIAQWEKSRLLLGVNPHLKYDLKWVGFGIGAHLGNLIWAPASPINVTDFDRGTRVSPIMPEVLVRVGRKDILDLQYNYGFNSPTAMPLLMHELSIGSGFGFKTDYNLRVGAALSNYYSTIFISAEALLNKNFGLTFKYNFGGEDFYYYNNNPVYLDRKGRILFGANYRFGFTK